MVDHGLSLDIGTRFKMITFITKMLITIHQSKVFGSHRNTILETQMFTGAGRMLLSFQSGLDVKAK
jgi:hypothetical protein